MKRSARLACGVALAALAPACAAQAQATYDRVDEVQDWGSATVRLIVDLGQEVSAGDIDAAAFEIEAARSDPRQEEPALQAGSLPVEEAYVSDAEGEPAETGTHVTLVPDYGPEQPLSAALNYGAVSPGSEIKFNDWTETSYTISLTRPLAGKEAGVLADTLGDYSRGGIDRFTFDQASYEDVEAGAIDLRYGWFAPEEDEGTNPLIVWLHGGGEGGTDPTMPLAANRADSLASDETQAHFDGAYVLVPQAASRWMEGPEGSIAGVAKPNALSIYSGALQELIEGFVSEREDIDTDRIYLTGASNGGFMTMRLILDHPDYYAAAVAIAQAMDPQYITEEELSGITDLPLWLVTAATDTTVPADTFVAPLYDRLVQAGASDVQLSYLPGVFDTSGRYEAPEGGAFEYNGHWSWVPFYNNDLAMIEGGHGQLYGPSASEAGDVGGHKVTSVMEWLAAQSR
ncbi:prolyl oligopeptidase family serine peptidase [Pseudoroseicyclus aestuarii]|uniref:Prolyl oligopeptidase family protein n=1 Tax=Pseudoroseicyclus aestuarii TaxID=1795041 RepID=A0A318SXY3_9RHOB|nr:prolyl oligopeptidase family serine peptidase [Pseudoroseicyclus aestuarii]PYE86185.1 prolyl oligopeptidase family protein [Pseudoroseicyclus aestuarii]